MINPLNTRIRENMQRTETVKQRWQGIFGLQSHGFCFTVFSVFVSVRTILLYLRIN